MTDSKTERARITRSLRCWNDLEEFGIDMLTGEACGLSMRLLIDLTDEGKKIMERFLGGTVQIQNGSNWNNGKPDKPHVASVLLPRSVFTDLAAFCLIMTGAGTVVACESGDVMEWDGSLVEAQERTYGVKRYYRRSTDPGTGDRNQHMASGRIE